MKPVLSLDRIALASYSFHGMLHEGVCDVFTYINLLRDHYRVDWADIWTGFIPTTDPWIGETAPVPGVVELAAHESRLWLFE